MIHENKNEWGSGMEKAMFPRTKVEGISLSRMIIGTNWLMGWSHTSPAADKMILERHNSKEQKFSVIQAFLEHGIDTIMGPISQSPALLEAINYAQEKTGKAMQLVDTPILNVEDSAAGRREAQAAIQQSAQTGAQLCLIHHSSAEKLVDKQSEQIKRIDDYTKMIRDAGMVPGLSAHMPELVVYSDANDYDVQTYIQIYNPMGFMMQVEIETVASIINNAKKPVMTIKPMAAGRCTPYVGFNFVWNTIRPCDMVTAGCFSAVEAYEDIEISLAAIERRFPAIGKRSSPNQNQAAFGK